MSHVTPTPTNATEAEERAKASERARGRLEEFTGALENRAGEMAGDGEMAARGKARELHGRRRQEINR